MTDQKGKVKLLEDFPGYDGRVSRLSLRPFVRERRTLRWAVRRSGYHDARVVVAVAEDVLGIDRGILSVSDDRESICPDTTLDLVKRWCNTRNLVVGRKKIVRNVFDEDAFTLQRGERWTSKEGAATRDFWRYSDCKTGRQFQCRWITLPTAGFVLLSLGRNSDKSPCNDVS